MLDDDNLNHFVTINSIQFYLYGAESQQQSPL